MNAIEERINHQMQVRGIQAEVQFMYDEIVCFTPNAQMAKEANEILQMTGNLTVLTTDVDAETGTHATFYAI